MSRMAAFVSFVGLAVGLSATAITIAVGQAQQHADTWLFRNASWIMLALVVLAIACVVGAVLAAIRNSKQPKVGQLPQSSRPPHPVIVIQFIEAAQLSRFEMTARFGDAFEIHAAPVKCETRYGIVTFGWDTPRNALREGETVPMSLKFPGKSGNWHQEREPSAFHLALDNSAVFNDVTSIEKAIIVDYKDVQGKHWECVCGLRYNRTTGRIEFLLPRVTPHRRRKRNDHNL